MGVIEINSEYEEVPEPEDGKVIINPYIEYKPEIDRNVCTEKRLHRWQDENQSIENGDSNLPPFYPLDKDKISEIIGDTFK